MDFSLSPFAPKNLVSRDGFGRPVPRQPAHSPHSGLVWDLLTRFLPISAAASICLYRQPPSGQSRVLSGHPLRTDGVHCRESVGTGPVALKAVSVTSATFSGITMGTLFCSPLVSHTHSWYVVNMYSTVQYHGTYIYIYIYGMIQKVSGIRE